MSAICARGIPDIQASSEAIKDIYRLSFDGGMISLPDLENVGFLPLGSCPAVLVEAYLNVDNMILTNFANLLTVSYSEAKIELIADSGS